MTAPKSHQEHVQEMISAGEYTRAEIIAKVGCTSGSFASYLTAWRSAAKFTGAPCYPIEVMEGDRKVFKFMTAEEADKVRVVPKAKAKGTAVNPLVKRDRLEQRILKLNTRIDKLKDAATSEVGELKLTIATAERRLLEIEIEAVAEYIDGLDDEVFEKVQAEYAAVTLPEEEEDVEEKGVDELE